jgi:hypothetical protein
MIEQAERFISRVPSDAVGFVFLDGGKPVQRDLEAIGRYERPRGSTANAVWLRTP